MKDQRIIQLNASHVGKLLHWAELEGWNPGLDDVGLDGVIEQQANYRKSGFELNWRNQRYIGQPNSVVKTIDGITIEKLGTDHLQSAIEFDAKIGGLNRRNFLNHWLLPSQTRQSLVAIHNGNICGLTTLRKCVEHHKLGPLLANNDTIAEALIIKAIENSGAKQVILDIPDNNLAAVNMVTALQMEPIFETARMYRGQAPTVDSARLFGVATLELG